jgi:galactokinase/galacturonokinase
MTIREAAVLWNTSERHVTRLCREGRISGAEKRGKYWMVPDGLSQPADGRTKEAKATAEGFGISAGVRFSRVDCARHAVDAFRSIYGKDPLAVGFTPYRVCPIGAHSDHNLGKITGFAIDKGIHFAFAPKPNGVVELRSLQFPKRAQWHVSDIPSEKENDWADHLRGATIALGRRYPLRTGICGVLGGELPIGGLSSSASVIITFLSALSSLNGIKLSPHDLIVISQEAENRYVGVACGKMDQSCEIYGLKDHLLYMDMRDDSYELIPANPNMKPFEFAVFFSGLERTLAGSKFNMRVDELRSAAYALKAYSGMEYGKFEETSLRDVPVEVFGKYKDRLPDNWRKRAEHWYGEFDRVQRGAEAWRRGDIEEYGRLCTESGRSSIYNWETGSPELKRMYEIIISTPGVYGGRFSGAGFEGCCMALIDPALKDEIMKTVETEYLRSFPGMREKYSAHICRSADGINH